MIRVKGTWHQDRVRTMAVEGEGGAVDLVRRTTHYSAEIETVAPAAPVELDEITGLVKVLEGDCRRTFDILRCSPMPGEYINLKRSGQAARWLEMAYEKGVDQAPIQVIKTKTGVDIRHDAPRARAPRPTGAEISWMDAMFDVLLTLRPGTLEWVLVTGRGDRVQWDDLAAYDRARRGVRQLKRLHKDALLNLLPVWLRRIHKI